MKTYDLLHALGELDDETVLAAHTVSAVPQKTAAIPIHKRIPAAALIAAVLAVLMSLGAVAYYVISHPKTVALMEAGPLTNGRLPVTVDETGQQIIDNTAIELNLSQTSNGTTVTVDSAMGFRDTTSSMLYLTLTITPPEGFEFPEDMADWCFFIPRITAVPDDIELGRVESTVKNPDGTASMLMLFLPNGDLKNHSLRLSLEGFGIASKETVHELFDGTRTIELPGLWEFTIELPELPETQEIAFDAAAVKAAGLPLTALRLNSFGGVAVLEQQDTSRLRTFRKTYGAQLKTDFPTVDFEHMDDAEFDALCASGDLDGFLTKEEFAHLQALLYEMTPFYMDFARPEVVTLEYPDGSEYTVSFGEYGDNLWIDWEQDGTPYCQIVFTNPQPISQVTAIIINGIRIPLNG